MDSRGETKKPRLVVTVKAEPSASSYLRIRVHTAAAVAEGLSERMFDLGAQSVCLDPVGSAAGTQVLEPPVGGTPLWPMVAVSGLFRPTEDVVALARVLNVGEHIEIGWMSQEDWSSGQDGHGFVRRFGDRLMVAPRHASTPGNCPSAVVRLDPGLAFGTGQHPTTALCLRWLATADLTDAAVLDYGCGSGVLGIAAALLGAKRVVAVDSEPQAITAAQDNARFNQVALEAVLSPGSFAATPSFDVVIANILANPLIELAPRLCGCLRPNGRLVLSGLSERDAVRVAAAYSDVQFAEPVVEQGWTRLVGLMKPVLGV